MKEKAQKGSLSSISFVIYMDGNGYAQAMEHEKEMTRGIEERRLAEELANYAGRSVARFHMPGHKGRGMGGFFRKDLPGWDITELSFSDNLSDPRGVILRAQHAFARAVKAEHTFFLVNGATSGIQGLLHYLKPNSSLLVSRDCHKSAIHGAMLAGHRVRYVMPELLQEENLFGCVSAQAIEKSLQREHFDAVLITSPNYYGLCADMPAISEAVRKHGALLFVDAAHGAHFPFSEALPSSPTGFADAWVASAHKTLNALGQAALLHLDGGMDAARMQCVLNRIVTSSPSYLLMASLDWARHSAERKGVWTTCAEAVTALATKIDRVPGLHTLGNVIVNRAGIADRDATRLVIDVRERGISGYTAMEALIQQDIYIEMADVQRLVLICTPADDPKWYDMLLRGLFQLPYGKRAFVPPPMRMAWHEQAMEARDILKADVKHCRLADAAEEIAAEPVGPYPPGIPYFVPGEKILKKDVEELLLWQKAGASLFGVRDGALPVVKR